MYDPDGVPKELGGFIGETRPFNAEYAVEEGLKYIWYIPDDGSSPLWGLCRVRRGIRYADAQLSKLQLEILKYLLSIEKKARTARKRHELQGFGIPWSSKEFLKARGLDDHAPNAISDAVRRLESRKLLERQRIGNVKPRTTHLRLTETARTIDFSV